MAEADVSSLKDAMHMGYRILFFSPYYDPYTSGITTFPKHVFSQLAHRHTVTVLTFRHDQNLPADEHIGAIYIHRMPFIFRISKGFVSPQSILTFARFLKHHDIVVLNIPNAEGVPLALLARLFQKPVVSLVHCVVTLPRTPLMQFVQLVLNMAIGAQLALTNEAVAYTCDYIKHTWLRHIFPLIKHTHYILPPVPLLKSSHAADAELLERKGKELWIGFAGRVAREKGLHVLIPALAQLRKRYPRTRLVLCGPYGSAVSGENDYFEEVNRLLAQTELPHLFLGTRHGDQLAAFYQACDVLVLPSVNTTEAFGMVQIESMCLGTPVVASNLPGVRVPVQLTGMGRVCEPGDATNLCVSIQDVLINRKSLTHPESVRRAREIFDFNTAIAHIEHVFNHAAEKR
jgi:glycosyltransferase involved in cell wall biosynthesis